MEHESTALLQRFATELDCSESEVIRAALGALSGILHTYGAYRPFALRRVWPHEVRVQPRVGPKIEEFAQAMRRGALFPPAVFVHTGLADGNNRAHAAALAERSLLTLVHGCDCPPGSPIPRLTYRPPSREQQRIQRIYRLAELRREVSRLEVEVKARR